MSDTDTREAARRLAERRRREEKPCAHCGKSMTGIATRRYCSDSCRVIASRARQETEHPADKRTMSERLAARRAENSRDGRIFTDSTEILRELREPPISRGSSPGAPVDSTAILREGREQPLPKP